MPINLVVHGDQIIIKPDQDRLMVKFIEGTSFIDEALVTGE